MSVQRAGAVGTGFECIIRELPFRLGFDVLGVQLRHGAKAGNLYLDLGLFHIVLIVGGTLLQTEEGVCETGGQNHPADLAISEVVTRSEVAVQSHHDEVTLAEGQAQH